MTLNKTLRWICIVGLFGLAFVPLIVSNHLFFPFITGKNFFFRIITEIIFSAWVVLAVTDPAYRPKKSWLGWAALAFVGIMLLADIFSIYPYKSFWSNYERMEGWVTLAHLLGYGIVAATVLGRDMWERLLQTWLGVSLTLILYSFLQIAGLLRIDQGANRIDATLGNSAYLAIYALFAAFLLLFFLIRPKDQFNARNHWFLALGFNLGFLAFIAVHLGDSALNTTTVTPAIFWAIAGIIIGDALLLVSALFERGYWAYIIIFVLELVVIFQTQTRGTILGIVGAIALASLLIGIFEKNRLWLKRTGWGIVIGLCVAMALFFALRNSPVLRSNNTLNRLASISLSDSTTQSRFILWDMAWKGFAERPVLGWGQESFNYIFNKFYDPRLYGDEQWFDRAHDVFFDWLTAGGALGLLSYLALFAAIIWYIWRENIPEDAEKNRATLYSFSVTEKAVLTGMLAGYFIHNVFVFDNITSYLFYVTIAAYVYSRRTMWPARDVLGKSTYQPNRFVAPITLVALICLLYFVNVKPIAANIDLIAAISPSSPSPTVSDTIAAYQKALSWRSFGDSEIREQIFGSLDDLTSQISSAAQSSGQADPGLIAEQNQFISFIEQQAQIQTSRTPDDARYYLLPGSVLADAGQYSAALPYLLKAQALSPKKQTILFELASVYIGQSNFDQALATLKTAYELDTQDQMARLLYAAAAIYDRNESLAGQILESSPAVLPNDIVQSDAILHAYYYVADYKAVLAIWQTRVATNPTDVNGYVSLAGAYLLLKDNKDAIATLQKLETVDQDASVKTQVDQYIQAIQQGKVQ